MRVLRVFFLTIAVAGIALMPDVLLAKTSKSAKVTKSEKTTESPKAGKSGKSAKTSNAAKPIKAATLGKAAKSSKATKSSQVSKAAKSFKLAKAAALVPSEPPRVSLGQAIGLHAVSDPADLRSSVALAIDSRTGTILFQKNSQAVLPIASITKIMTAMVVLDAKQSMVEPLEISSADVDLEKNSRSRLRTGSTLSRGEMLQLALMASENRAASALARYYPGGADAFVVAMNRKAKAMQMEDTQFIDATGLSSRNMSNAKDLAQMVRKAGDYPLIRQYSTAGELTVDTGLRMITFRNTNRLIENPEWQISLSKTGYISEAGNCLVMHTRINDQPVVMVLLDAVGRYTRFADASRLRTYLESDAQVIKAQAKAKSHG